MSCTSTSRSVGEPDPIDDTVVPYVKSVIPELLSTWKSKTEFAPHINALSDALKHYEKSEYRAAASIIWLKVEGILRTMNFGKSTGLGQRTLPKTLIDKVRVNISGVTALPRRRRRQRVAHVAGVRGGALGRCRRLVRTRATCSPSAVAAIAPLARLGYDVAAPGAARSEHLRVSEEGVPWGGPLFMMRASYYDAVGVFVPRFGQRAVRWRDSSERTSSRASVSSST